MDFEIVEFVGGEAHYHQRLFLEAWMYMKDPNAGNDHMAPRSLQVLSTHLKFSRVTQIQHAQRFTFKMFSNRA